MADCRTLLEQHTLEFTEKLDVGILLPYLQDHLSDNDMLKLRNVSAVESRDILFDIIRRKCPHSFQPFYESLVKTGQIELAKLLAENDQSLPPIEAYKRVSTTGLKKKNIYSYIVTGFPDECERFVIKLITDKRETALRFTVKFGDKVGLNSNFGGKWGHEEVVEDEFPFKPNTTFNLTIVNELYAFQIFVNGNHFCTYTHRFDANVIKGLKIEGDVILMGVHVKAIETASYAN